MKNKKTYFASDFHLGVPGKKESIVRELKIIKWLDEIKVDAKDIFLVGDIFDFWFEWNKVVPKGNYRLLSKLSEISEIGIKIHFLKGNHDLWTFGYLKEVGLKVYDSDIKIEIDGKKFLISHGDGIGNFDFKYKILKKTIFENKFFQKLFSILHPDISIKIANYFSKKSRLKKFKHDDNFYLKKLKKYCNKVLEKEKIDYFIFGHYHIVSVTKINDISKLFILGDWVNHNSYLQLYEGKPEMKKFNYQ